MTGTRQVKRTKRTARTTAGTTELKPKMRELAHREGPDVDVALFWRPEDNSLVLLLVEVPTGVLFEIPVPPEVALDAFNHPYAYLPAQQADPWAELLAA
jgi:hypothetical protein